MHYQAVPILEAHVQASPRPESMGEGGGGEGPGGGGEDWGRGEGGRGGRPGCGRENGWRPQQEAWVGKWGEAKSGTGLEKSRRARPELNQGARRDTDEEALPAEQEGRQERRHRALPRAHGQRAVEARTTSRAARTRHSTARQEESRQQGETQQER